MQQLMGLVTQSLRKQDDLISRLSSTVTGLDRRVASLATLAAQASQAESAEERRAALQRLEELAGPRDAA